MSYLVDDSEHYWDPPGIFSHKIQRMPHHKPSIENHRKLNLPMQEVAKKEIIKWLDAVVIYPIAHNSWCSLFSVSLIRVVSLWCLMREMSLFQCGP